MDGSEAAGVKLSAEESSWGCDRTGWQRTDYEEPYYGA